MKIGFMEKVLIVPEAFLHFLRNYSVKSTVVVTILILAFGVGLREERGGGFSR